MSDFVSLEEDCFIRFKSPIESIELPQKFNYPFNFIPHPLAVLAAKELQVYLEVQTDWEHEFGIDQRVEGTNIGKMFGVLVVRNRDGEVGYLAAFSGKVGGDNKRKGFAPPIVDMLNPEGFYRKGEHELVQMNIQIRQMEQAPDFLACKAAYERDLKQSIEELERCKNDIKIAKQARDIAREEALKVLPPEELSAFLEKLNNESIKMNYDQKHLVKFWKAKNLENQERLAVFQAEIARMKEERKAKSAALQQKLFEQYQFLNSKGESQTLFSIFQDTDQKIPPAGAGDCAGPKMLQFAYEHQMQPLTMAEFWWGQSPKSEIRKHAHFYPSCNGKCKPILGFMLQGIEMDENPHIQSTLPEHQPTIIYEDEDILVLNKPAEYLSVPGKIEAESVYSFVKERYPDATGPLIVHRLDMSTSGLMVIAKTLAAYHHLQNQFLQRVVKKRYVALLNGTIANDKGVVELPLRVDLDNRPRQLVCYDFGKPAVTHYKVLDRLNQQTRVHFFPVTGRTHQLRMHAAHSLGLNAPIVGDDLYGQKANRMHLHAEGLWFIHPRSGLEMSFEVVADF